VTHSELHFEKSFRGTLLQMERDGADSHPDELGNKKERKMESLLAKDVNISHNRDISMGGLSLLKQTKTRQLLLSIAIVSLIFSATILFQNASATTTGGMIQKSISFPAGADGRSFAQVNDTYTYPATERVDYNNPFHLYYIDYNNVYGTNAYTGIGPRYESPSSFDPRTYSLGPLSGVAQTPEFVMTHNDTSNVVSPTITLSDRDNVTLGFGSTTEVSVDATNILAATLQVTSGEVGNIVALTGFVSGGAVTYTIYNPNHVYYGTGTISPGYFAVPFLANNLGTYLIYAQSASNSYVKVTPSLVSTTSLALGQYTSGEINIPAQYSTIGPVPEPEASQIVAVSYDVSAGQDYAFSFAFTDNLKTLASKDSSFFCLYFDVGTYEGGLPVMGGLGQGGSLPIAPIVSTAPISGKVYVVLVVNFISRISYSMGVQPANILTAPLNAAFDVKLPTPSGAQSVLYRFTLPSESMVRLNSSSVSGTMSYYITASSSTGVRYLTGPYTVGTKYIGSGYAENNYQNTLHLGAGEYVLQLYSSGSTEKQIQINTYSIESYTFGTAFTIGVHTTKAFAVNVTTGFNFESFNVTMLSKDFNRSMTYQIALFDAYNRLVNAFVADGSSASHFGIGNKETGGSWQGVAGGAYYVDPGPATQLDFSGNATTRQCVFIPSYAGTYFIVLDFLNAYNATDTGANNAHRWTFANSATEQLRIDLSKPDYSTFSPVVAAVTSVTIDSSTGTGSNTVTLSTTGVNLVMLTLTPEVNTWTRISISITNGTSQRIASYYEQIVDLIRYYGFHPGGAAPMGNFTFDRTRALQLWPAYTVVGVSPQQNTTYVIEFGALTSTMAIRFLVNNLGAAHTVVSFSVTHYPTPAFSGLIPPVGPLPAPAFPVAIVVVIVVIVVIALVVLFIVVKKKSK
jgi:hypothetical protein